MGCLGSSEVDATDIALRPPIVYIAGLLME